MLEQKRVLTEEETRLLEREFGELCAKEASKRSTSDGYQDLDQYLETYKEVFSVVKEKALEEKEKKDSLVIDVLKKRLLGELVSKNKPDFSSTDSDSDGIFNPFEITEEEFNDLNKSFGRLCHDAAWKVIKSYRQEEEENVAQELFIAMLRSASQYRRKCFFDKAFKHLVKLGLGESPLVKSWQKNFEEHKMSKEEEAEFLEFFGELPEEDDKPSPKDRLVIDDSAARYIKTCIWNQQKAALKGLGKERVQRKGEISLSEADGWLNIEEKASESEVVPTQDLRSELFDRVRITLADRDKRAAQTYNILTDPKNDKEVFPQTSDYKVKINSVRKRTKQSYKSIKTDLQTIEDVFKNELIEHQKRLIEANG